MDFADFTERCCFRCSLWNSITHADRQKIMKMLQETTDSSLSLICGKMWNQEMEIFGGYGSSLTYEVVRKIFKKLIEYWAIVIGTSDLISRWIWL